MKFAFFLLAVSACLLAMPAAAAPPADAGLFPDPVVAKGRGFTVKRSEVDEAYRLLRANAISSGRALAEDRRDFFMAQLLDRLISTRVLVAHASAEDQKRAGEKADKYLAKAKQDAGSAEVFKLQLKGLGLSEAAFRAGVVEQATCEEVINREVRSGIAVSEADARRYYETNATRFAEPEMIRVAHILLSTKDPSDPSPNPTVKRNLPAPQKEAKRLLAESVQARARKGDDFGRLVKEFSEDAATKDKGGEYTFARGRMVAEFEATAFSLPVGQVSEVVTTIYGYHIIKVLEKIPARKIEFAKVSDSIKQQVQEERLNQQMPAYLQNLRQAAGVEILDDALKINVNSASAVKP